MDILHTDYPMLTMVLGGRLTVQEEEQSAIVLVRDMGDGSLADGLAKLGMIQALDGMRYDWNGARYDQRDALN